MARWLTRVWRLRRAERLWFVREVERIIHTAYDDYAREHP